MVQFFKWKSMACPFWVCAWCAQPVIQVKLVSRILKIMKIGLLDRKPIWINFMILGVRNFFFNFKLDKNDGRGRLQIYNLKILFPVHSIHLPHLIPITMICNMICVLQYYTEEILIMFTEIVVQSHCIKLIILIWDSQFNIILWN